jgi:hypothetical protein
MNFVQPIRGPEKVDLLYMHYTSFLTVPPSAVFVQNYTVFPITQ